MFDLNTSEYNFDDTQTMETAAVARCKSATFPVFKRSFDIAGSLILILPMIVFCIILSLLNPFYNKGKLFYIQPRMGRDCAKFSAIKFRSMTAVQKIERAAHDPLETQRITPLGRLLRKSRIDELPQIINVLRGDMSLIGPRPDYYEHAVEYLRLIPGYRERHTVRPGISGLAQTELGYIEGVEATRRKVAADLFYISNATIRMELRIFWRTLVVVGRRAGA